MCFLTPKPVIRIACFYGLQENPVAGRDFLKRIGSNHVLRSQAICFEPKKSWKILADLPAEGRSPEAVNSHHPIWLALLDDFRTFDWAEEYKYPTVILAQMNQLLAECRDDQPAVAP